MFFDIFYSILLLMAGLGAFLFGLHMFSSFFKRNNKRIKGAFSRVGENRFVNLGLGTGTTVLIQSSTATTVTIVGLVNAGVMTLSQATPAIFGANLGSALSDMLLSLSAFRIRYIFMAFVLIGVLAKVLTKQNSWLCKISDLFISFGIIFIGLNIMRGAFSDSEHLTNAFTRLFEVVHFPLLLVLLGFILTAIIQSSSASVGLYIAMAQSGVFGINSVLYLVIGSSLGTTLTMLIASIPANRDAKRTALVHLLFNLIGTAIWVPIIWGLGHILVPWFTDLITNIVWQISIFSAILNTTTVILLIGFSRKIAQLVTWIIKDKPQETPDSSNPLTPSSNPSHLPQ